MIVFFISEKRPITSGRVEPGCRVNDHVPTPLFPLIGQ